MVARLAISIACSSSLTRVLFDEWWLANTSLNQDLYQDYIILYYVTRLLLSMHVLKKNILVFYMEVEQFFFFNFIHFWLIGLIEKVFY